MSLIRHSVRWGLFVALVALLACAGWIYLEDRRLLWELDREQVLVDRRLSQMLATNRVLKTQIDTITSEACFKAVHGEVEKNVSDLRGLSFLSPVNYRRMPRSQLREYMLSKLRSQYAPEEFRDYERALKRIGLVPREVDLVDMVTELYSEQVAAFYDPDTRELFTFDGLSLKDNFERVILAHELVHVLQDQHFDLGKLPLKRKDNDDAALAADALVEGDASHLMNGYLQRFYNANQMFEDLGVLFSQKTDKLFSAPAYLRDIMLFPYQEGEAFVTALDLAGGQGAVNLAYQNPPLSTEQILHPEKYLAGSRDDPRTVMVSLNPSPSWRKAHENTVGELGIRSLLASALGNERAERAAAGWGGDRYVVYDAGNEQWVLVWKSVWDSRRDAREFFDALEEFFRDRYQSGRASRSKRAAFRQAPADSVFFSVASQKQNILIEKDTVFLLDAPDRATLQRLLAQVVRHQKNSAESN
jgi:hypothetical protein